MKINSDRIRREMEAKKIAHIVVARKANVQPVYLGVVLANGDAPDDVAAAIAEAVGVSLEEIAVPAKSQTIQNTPRMVHLNATYIREIIRNKGLSVADLARLVGVHGDNLKRQLDRGTMDAEFAKRVADMLNVPIVEITLAA